MPEPTEAGGRNTAAVRELEALSKIGPRRAGSEPERRAARQIDARLRDFGRDVELEPIRVRPNFALTHLVHAVTGVIASVLSVYVPAAGLLLAAAATASAFGDLTGSFYLVRSLMPLRASQNVVSDEDNDKPGVIVLVAHCDTPLTGMLLSPRLARWPRALLISLGVITICTLGRLVGMHATWFTFIQFIPTVVLIALTPVFADTAISPADDSAADNAAGVAAALQLAESQSGRLTHFDLLLVFTGASATFGLGMREWLKRHRKELDPEATAVIAIDNIAAGEVAYAAKEGGAVASRMHPALTEIAGEAGATSFESGEVSDSYLARASGLPALRISTTERGDVDTDTLARVCDFTTKLLGRIDDEIGPRLG